MSTNKLSILTSKIYRSRTVLLEQLAAQGYNVDEYSHFGLNDVQAMINSEMLDMVVYKGTNSDATATAKPDATSQKMVIKYFLSSIKVAPIQKMVADLFDSEEPVLSSNHMLYIVSLEEIGDSVRDCLVQLWKERGLFVHAQYIERLQINVLKHERVPPHSVMTDEDTSVLMKTLNIDTPDLLPPISRFDPAAIAIFLRPNQVCLVKRFSKTALSAPYYRICV